MTWFDQDGVEHPGSCDSFFGLERDAVPRRFTKDFVPPEPCNCDQARALTRWLTAKRLEVIELRLRAWLNDARRAPWSRITDIRAKQERRYARQRERLQAVMALRVIAEVRR